MALSRRVVDDLETLKAVSHPLRMRLLGELRTHGPATASALARRVGESSGSTSYHLRQLERFGFVGDDDDQPSGRERRWRAVHDVTTLPDGLWESEGGDVAFREFRRRQLDVLARGIEAWTAPGGGFGHSDFVLHLEEEELRALLDEVVAVVSRYTDRTGPHDVALHLLALPRPT